AAVDEAAPARAQLQGRAGASHAPARVRPARRAAPGRDAAVADGAGRRAARTLARSLAVGALVLGLVAAGVWFMGSRQALPQAPAFTDACNGDPALCGRRVDEVVFPGAHNSMSSVEFNWMFPNQELASVSLLG